MSVYFPLENLYDYIFSSQDGFEDIEEIDKQDFRRFCFEVEKNIVSHANEYHGYRYVFFEKGADFFDNNRKRYLDFGKYVVFTGQHSKQLARKVEEKYDDAVITNALKSAFASVRSSLT